MIEVFRKQQMFKFFEFMLVYALLTINDIILQSFVLFFQRINEVFAIITFNSNYLFKWLLSYNFTLIYSWT